VPRAQMVLEHGVHVPPVQQVHRPVGARQDPARLPPPAQLPVPPRPRLGWPPLSVSWPASSLVRQALFLPLPPLSPLPLLPRLPLWLWLWLWVCLWSWLRLRLWLWLRLRLWLWSWLWLWLWLWLMMWLWLWLCLWP